ncbi:MAG TPA: hypothetical protein VI424_03955, partial [Terriglobales bacterium]
MLITVAMAAVAQQPSSAPAPSGAQDLSALEQKIRDLEDRIVTLEGQLRQLKAQGAPAPAPAPSAAPSPAPGAPATAQAPAPAEQPPQVAQQPQVPANEPRLGGAGAAAAKALNPDISAIGDFIASAGHNPVVPSPSFEMHETELGFQAIIDPYARGDLFLSFGEAGVNLEEGYITFTALPASFVARAGKMRASFGKVNTMHNHVLPWVNRPLVTQNLVGGEDGINDAGVSVNRIIPAPKNW